MQVSKLSTQVWIGFLLFLVSPLNCFAGVVPVPGVVMLIDVTLADSTPNIQKIVLQSGAFNDMRIKAPSGNVPGHRLVVLGRDGSSLYEMEFYFPVAITIPPAQPEGPVDQLPSVIPLRKPEVTLIIPYFEDAETILIMNSGNSNPAAIKSMSGIERVTGEDTASAPQPAPAELDKMNLLIMASGYDSGSFGAFQSQADKIKGTILGVAPFVSQTSKISVHIYANTKNLGCYSGCYGIDRLLCCDSSKVISAASTSGFLFDEIIVVHNTATYAGGGYREEMDAYKTNSYNTPCAVYDGDYTALMVLHEFGHSFGNLCDEYSYGSEGYTYTSCVNCMASCSQYPAASACQLGCDAKPSYYRPNTSIMLDYTNPVYNDASVLADYSPDGLKKRLNFFTSSQTQTVLSVNPASRDVAKDAGTTTFSVSNTGTGTMTWSALVTGGSWLTIISGASGTNSGTINCSYPANTTTAPRTGTIRVTATGATGSPVDLTVTQAGTGSLAASFVGSGLCIYNSGAATWSQVSSTNPENMIYSGSTLYADFVASGLYKWDGAAWTQLTSAKPENMVATGSSLYADFGTSGLYKWDGAAWTQLTSTNPENMVTAGSLLYADFGALGLYKWDGTAWTQLTSTNPENMVTDGSLLYADFGVLGLYKWDGTAWTQLTSTDPENMVTSSATLYVNFGAPYGLYKWDGAAWTQLTTANPENMVTSGSTLYVDFGALGLYKWDGAAWAQLTSVNRENMVASDSVLYVDFGALGLYKWESSSWSQLTGSSPVIMAVSN
jgi:IgA Peptidase M64/Viral BACON domain